MEKTAFFVFDSEHLDEIQTRLYGFYITEKGIITSNHPHVEYLYENNNEEIWNATGAWVLVRRTDASIEIIQDNIGCFGLFLYRKGDYWAVSNSFNCLLDYLKADHKLSLNREYARTYLTQQLCISAYGQTLIREIEWLDRRSSLFINIKDTTLLLKYRDLGERMIPVDTEEGIQILDTWHDKWASFVARADRLWPGIIRMDLSGGFDTRMALAPILSSGIDLNRVYFYSHLNRKEDYRIASMIADKFGFKLNEKPDSHEYQAYLPVESYPARSLMSIFFEKEIYTPNTDEVRVPTLVFSGFGGGLLRNHWANYTSKKIINTTTKKIPKCVSHTQEIQDDIKSVLQHSFDSIASRLSELGTCKNEDALNGLHYYMETRNRSHFGMAIARSCLSQSYNNAILLDPLLLKLRVPDDHPLLLCALIFTRYKEDLLSIPIEGGRSIPEETIRITEELNRKFPRDNDSIENRGTSDTSGTFSVMVPQDKTLFEINNTDELRSVKDTLKDAFSSPMVYKLFNDSFGGNPKDWVDPVSDRLHPDANKYAVVAISKALCDIKLGKDAPKDFSAFFDRCGRVEQEKMHEVNALKGRLQNIHETRSLIQRLQWSLENRGVKETIRRIWKNVRKR